MELLYYHLIEKGIFICETRSCFLSTSHTDEDIDQVVRAVKESLVEMREGGFLPDETSSQPEDESCDISA